MNVLLLYFFLFSTFHSLEFIDFLAHFVTDLDHGRIKLEYEFYLSNKILKTAFSSVNFHLINAFDPY